MDSIVNRLTEIEETAEAIVRNAEKEKERLDQEYDKKRYDFDTQLEAETQARIGRIRSELERQISGILGDQSDENNTQIRSLQADYEKRHTEYAQEILRRITEV